MTPSPKSPKGSEQCQYDCNGVNYVFKRAVSQIDRKLWATKRDLDRFYVNTVMRDQTALSVVTPPSIYHGFSTRKTLWEENFTIGEFTAVKMKKFGHSNVKTHREIKGSDKYVTLDISMKFDSLD